MRKPAKSAIDDVVRGMVAVGAGKAKQNAAWTMGHSFLCHLALVAQKTGRTAKSVCFLPRSGLWTGSLFTPLWTKSTPCLAG